MYDPRFVQPMRDELVQMGVKELRTSAEVDEFMRDQSGTAMIVVNSICGCAAGAARPAVGLALKSAKKPARVATVFAGQDREATERARSYITGYPPSSPSVALFRDGQLVHMVPRHDIEGHTAEQIAQNLRQAFEQFC